MLHLYNGLYSGCTWSGGVSGGAGISVRRTERIAGEEDVILQCKEGSGSWKRLEGRIQRRLQIRQKTIVITGKLQKRQQS